MLSIDEQLMFAHERSLFYNMKTELQNYNLFTATEHDDRAFPVLLSQRLCIYSLFCLFNGVKCDCIDTLM